MLLVAVPVSKWALSLLWLIAAAGQVLAALIQMGIPEEKPDEEETSGDELAGESFWRRNLEGFRAIRRIRPLLAFFAVILITSIATSVTGDAFEISMVTRGLDPRLLALLAIDTDLLGVVAPLLAVSLGRRLGARRAMIPLLLAPAPAVCLFFAGPGLTLVAALFVLFNLFDDLWDPVADTHLQSLIPSRVRAAVGSIANQSGELAGLLGITIFFAILGRHGEALAAATPDLVSAFNGETVTDVPVPVGLFGLPLPDLVLVLLTLFGLAGVLVLAVRRWHRTARGEGAPEGRTDRTKRTTVSAEDTPQRKRLIRVKENLGRLLDTYNPGEELSWWVAGDAFTLPEKTLATLKVAGEALPEFFRAANDLFQREVWIRQRLEKRVSPFYALLNRAQPGALPYLIRPDVVCDTDWDPKLVELEITVGCRADTSVMAEEYGLDPGKGLVKTYADFLRRKGWTGETLAFVTAPHPFFLDLPDDARAFAAMLRREGADVVVLTRENLPHLRFDGQRLLLSSWDGRPARVIRRLDRFIDHYELAELQHPGMGALLDAYLGGAVTDINTCKQFLDEKDWMSLFWEPRLRETWEKELGEWPDALLRRMIPGTWIVRPGMVVPAETGESVPILEISDLKPEHRRFVIKESGTSTTASGAQAFHVLSEMEGDDIHDLVQGILESGTEYILQELVESARVTFSALDPEDDRVITQEGARFKLSIFDIDGCMCDIRYVASNVKYAVNDQDCVVGVVRY